MSNMKFQSLLLMIIFVTFVFGVFPYILIQLNNGYFLPIYDFVYLKILGVPLAGMGMLIVTHCLYLFFKTGKGTPVPINPPKKFVTVGLYKFVRNPMYLGAFMIILSEFFIFGHLLLLVYLLIMTVIANFFVILYEEKDLKKRFGKKYIDYIKKVPRWIPRFGVKT